MDFNKLIARVKAILLAPKSEWQVIAGESTDVPALYRGYIAWLAAIPALVGLLIALSFGFGRSVVGVIVQYGVSLAMVFICALIVEALAPTFGASKDRVQALKVVAYSLTAVWVATVATLVPILGGLIVLAGLGYTVYLMYLGLPVLMKCPQDKAVGYTATSIIATILVNALVFGVLGRFFWVGPLGY